MSRFLLAPVPDGPPEEGTQDEEIQHCHRSPGQQQDRVEDDRIQPHQEAQHCAGLLVLGHSFLQAHTHRSFPYESVFPTHRNTVFPRGISIGLL